MENFWKEYTIFLKEGKEYCYDIQNENTNCVLVRNYDITNINVGIKPHTYEVVINPNRIGTINRPFPLNYVYLFTDKSTPVSIIETATQNPINNFIKQEITKNIIIQNTPKIDVTPLYKLNTPARISFRIGRHEERHFTFNLGEYGRTNINLHVYARKFLFIGGLWRPATVLPYSSASNDNIHFFEIPLNLSGTGNYFRTFKKFPFRFLKLSFFGGTAGGRRRPRSYKICLKISFSR